MSNGLFRLRDSAAAALMNLYDGGVTKITLDADLDYTFKLKDRYGDGLKGRVVLYLGDEDDSNRSGWRKS